MRRISATIALCIVVTLLGTTRSGPAQDAGGYVVQIRAGTCGAPGDALAQLDDLPVAGGAAVGAESASAAVSSYSTVPLSLEALTGTASAVFVLDSTTGGVVACGEIGGVVDSSGALSIGLRPSGDSGFSGIAYLAPAAGNPAQTGVSTFLAQTSTGGSAEPAATSMTAEGYASMVRNQVTILGGSLQRITTLFDKPRVNDGDWRNQVGAELFLWRLIYRVAQEAIPPDSRANYHERYLEALSLLDSASRDIVEWLNNGDETVRDQASTKIQDAVQALIALDTPDATGTPAAGASTPTP